MALVLRLLPVARVWYRDIGDLVVTKVWWGFEQRPPLPLQIK
jgi:hypothetical protein